jgi:RNA polymerase sigma-70 factor (ECF subfamily)
VNGQSDLTDQIVALLPRLRRFALTLTRHPEDGDDLVQMTVERALPRLDSWKEGSRLDSWLFKIMQNIWIDQLRSRRTRGTPANDVDLGALPGLDGRAAAESRLTLDDTLKAVMRLPDEQRSALLLVAVEGHSYREAAEVLQVPIGTIMSRIARARLSLEALSGDLGPASEALS